MKTAVAADPSDGWADLFRAIDAMTTRELGQFTARLRSRFKVGRMIPCDACRGDSEGCAWCSGTGQREVYW